MAFPVGKSKAKGGMLEKRKHLILTETCCDIVAARDVAAKMRAKKEVNLKPGHCRHQGHELAKNENKETTNSQKTRIKNEDTTVQLAPWL